MLIEEFDYQLPEELIAQHPLPNRIDSRMMVINREMGTIEDTLFSDFPEYLDSNDLLVLNNTRVFPARLYGEKENGEARIEVLLSKEIKENLWEVLMKPAKRLKIGDRIVFSPDLSAVVEGRNEKGRRYLSFEIEKGNLQDILEEIGKIPLPPYIHREEEEDISEDRERYQTVFAKKTGSVAAPTAGLHFNQEILKRIKSQNTDIIEVTLNVGTGTFTPVNTDNVEDFKMDRESYEISKSVARRIARQMIENKPITAVGTTVVRTLESNYLKSGGGRFKSRTDQTELFIHPGFTFHVVNRLLTNFHLPKSSLLLLVSAIAGKELIKEAYQHAIEKKYRFYSYGDCMLII